MPLLAPLPRRPAERTRNLHRLLLAALPPAFCLGPGHETLLVDVVAARGAAVDDFFAGDGVGVAFEAEFGRTDGAVGVGVDGSTVGIVGERI